MKIYLIKALFKLIGFVTDTIFKSNKFKIFYELFLKINFMNLNIFLKNSKTNNLKTSLNAIKKGFNLSSVIFNNNILAVKYVL